jgi:hypothetical protein
LAEQQAHYFVVTGTEREAAARGQVERAWRAADLGEDGGKAAAAQPFLADPQGFVRPASANEDQALGIEPEMIEATAIEQAGLAARGRFRDPQNRAGIVGSETDEECRGKACGCGCIPSGLAADLMEGIAAEAAGEPLIEIIDTKGEDISAESLAFGFGEPVLVEALDFGDPAP